MKLFISLNNPDVLSGFVNIDPIVAATNPDKLNADPSNLTPYIDNGSVEELISPDVLDFYSLTDKVKVLDHWLGKMAHGGLITVGGLDVAEATRVIHLGKLNIEQTNVLLYGVSPLQRKSILSIHDVVIFFEAKSDYRIVEKKIDNLFYLVTAQRN